MDKDSIINKFEKDQTLTNIQEIKNAGMGLYKIQNNKWEELKLYTLPVRFVKLYNDSFELIGIGRY